MERTLLELARYRGLSIGCAESVTGGQLIAALISVPGFSATTRGGIVAYSPELKKTILKLPFYLLRSHGTISDVTASMMAYNGAKVLGSDICIAVTGNAGPSAQEGKAVGTIHIAVSINGIMYHKDMRLPSNWRRQQIQEHAWKTAIGCTVNVLNGNIKIKQQRPSNWTI